MTKRVANGQDGLAARVARGRQAPTRAAEARATPRSVQEMGPVGPEEAETSVQEAGDSEKESVRGDLKPKQCRKHLRLVLAREFEDIVESFVDAAKKGSYQHVKLVTELLEPKRRGSSKRKGSAAKLLKELERERGDQSG